MNLRTVAKVMPQLLLENLKINSSIDATQFNIRYCTREFGVNRKCAEESLPVLAQLNLDGNCYMITLIAVMFMFTNSTSVAWLELITIGVLVLFLSLGAPNQPGSILIGTLIIISFLGANELLPLAICSEVLFGAAQNITNVIGDIVALLIEDKVYMKL